MKRDWNERAREDAYWYVDTGHADSEASFDASGARDVALLFRGEEALLAPADGRPVAALELGCGAGRMTRHVAPRVGRLVAVDVSAAMLSIARRRLAAFPQVEYLETDGRSLRGVADGTIDLVFSAHVLQHVPRTVAAAYVAEALRVLRPGGTLLVHVPGAVGDALPPEPPEADTWSLRHFAPQELADGLVGAGFAFEGCRIELVGAPQNEASALVVKARKP
jgi:SAM-dependent methyltransferase